MYKAVYALSIAVLTLAVGYLSLMRAGKQPVRGKRLLTAESFACGIFLGAGLLHMLGEASSNFISQGVYYPIAPLIVGIVFLSFLWLEHVCQEYYSRHSSDAYFALLALLMLSVHSFLEGGAIGLSHNTQLAIVLFIAVISHKGAASFAVATQLVRTSMTRLSKWLCYLVYAAMTPIGILAGSLVGDAHQHIVGAEVMPVFLSLAAGTFFYLGTLHGLEKCVLLKQCCNLKNYSFVILGFALMAVLAYYV